MTYVGIFDEIEKKDENKALKKRIIELEGINKDHQKLNGKLHQENKRLKEDIDRLSEERDNYKTLAENKAT